MNPFEKGLAVLLGVLVVPIVLWSYGHWMTATGSGTYSPTTSVTGSPSISASQIDKVLCSANSPACGTGNSLESYGQQYGIDPAFGLAVFKHESGFGTAGVARQNLSLGNLRCIPDAACQGGYAAFPSWEQGYSAFYKLISGPLYVGSGLTTPEQILARYAPSGDGNNPVAYAEDVRATMTSWRTAA